MFKIGMEDGQIKACLKTITVFKNRHRLL